MRAFLCSLNESNILFLLGDIFWMEGWHNFHSFYYQFVLGIFGNFNLKHVMHEISLSLCSPFPPKNKLLSISVSPANIFTTFDVADNQISLSLCVPYDCYFVYKGSCEKHLKYWICLKSPKYILSKRVYENLC